MDKTYKNNKDYYLSFGLIFLVYCLSINTDLAEYSQHQLINIPEFYFYLSFGVDLMVIISLILIFFFKKIGVILFPIFVLMHFGLHNYYLSTYLYSDITTLFLYIGVGLLAIIPRWDNLK